MKFVRNVTEWIEKKPVIYHGHTAFLDFSRYGPLDIKLQSKYTEKLGPRMANMALLICLKMKIIEKVLKRDYSTNESLLIICLWL